VAGRELRRADVELAILVLPQALRSSDNHRADRVGALDVAVVVDLDPPRRTRQAKALGERREQLAPLGGGGGVASQRLARVGKRVIDELLLFAAARVEDLDLVAALGGQRLRQQRLLLDRVRDQDQPRSRLVVVELRQEGAEHLTRTERAVGLREIGAVAPVLPGAAEEHLHAEEAALLMHGEHVRLLNAARIDALMRLHGRERGKAVAVDRGALVVQRGGGFLHLGRELLLHPAAAPGEKVVGLAHQLLVIGEFDLACAWARAALDLVEQARPRAALEKTIRAGAQQERALQGRDGTVDRPYRRERPVVAARPGAGAAVLEDLRRPVVAGDQYIRERLVVAQQHVEARAQPL